MKKVWVLVLLSGLMFTGCPIEEDSPEFALEKLQIGGQAYFVQFAQSKDAVIWLR